MRMTDPTGNDEIENIKKEIRVLKKELRSLKRKRSYSNKSTVTHTVYTGNEVFRSKSDILEIYKGNSYIRTVIAIIKGSALYEFWIKSLTFFRRFRLITYLAGIISYIIALVGTGALLLIYISVFGLILLIFLVFAVNTVILAGSERKRANLYFESLSEFERIYVFFTHRRQKFAEDSYFSSYVKNIAESGNYTVLIVTPRLISNRSIDGRRGKGYLTFRRDYRNVYMLRQHYYFSFKKEILPKIADKTIFIF